MSNIVSKNPKSTFAAFTAGLESLVCTIKDETLRKICTIFSPLVIVAVVFLFKNLERYIEYKRGLKTYRTIIADYEKDLLNSAISMEEKKHIQEEIAKCKADINKIKIDNIKITID